MPGIYEMMQGALAAGQQGAEQGKQRRLAQMMSQAMSGPADQRQGAVAQMDDVSRKRLGEHAMMFDALPDEQKAQAYPQLAAEAQALGIPAPAQWSESFRPGIQRLAQAFGGMSAAQSQGFTLSPGSAHYDASGRLVASQPFAPGSSQLATVPDGQGGSVQMLFDPRTGQFSQPNYAGGPSGGAPKVLDDALANAVMQQESGGDPNAVSPAGARGLMQLMPGTQRDPGFGVAPAKDDSPQENVRLGRDYLQAMLHRYNGDQQLALAAYNAGPGRVDSALRSAGGDPRRAIGMLPQETQKYVPSVQGRMGYTPPKPEAGNKAPEGYRWSADGRRMEVIPGGPADKSGPNSTTTGGANAQKLQQANAQKMAQFDAAERGIQRLEAASKSIAGNSFLDGGPMDQQVLKYLPQGQELEQASAALLPILTALTRVPGIGAQSDWEGRLQKMQMPSAEFPPEVNARAVTALRAYMQDLKTALQHSSQGAANVPDSPADVPDDLDALLEKYR